MVFNPYKILMVDPAASFDVIKAVYRALMKQKEVHPDLGGDTNRAQEINNAYEILSDPVEKEKLDLLLLAETKKEETKTIEQILVVCTHCATLNELESRQFISVAKCGYCRRSFFEPDSNNEHATYEEPQHYPEEPPTTEKKEKLTPEFAQYLYNKGLYLRALEDYLHLIQVEPNQPSHAYQAGLCYYRLKNFEKSSHYFHLAVKKESHNFNYNFWLGKSLYRLKQFSQAIDYLEKAQKYRANNLHCLAILGTCYFKVGNYSKAIFRLSPVISQKPGLYQAIYWIAFSYFKEQRFSQAKIYFERGKQILPHIKQIDDMIIACEQYI
ncbi:MAG: tetratricopeptide (TPR) repeat protein [bacterium]|jgi:tetratricopeptide (TPR) repeat protein